MNTNLIFNLIMYLLFAWWMVRKQGITVASSLAIYYTIIAALGILVVNNGLYEAVFSIRDKNYVVLEPYIFCFLSVVALILPLRKVQLDNMNLSAVPFDSPVLKYGIYIWYLDMIGFIVLKIGQAILAMSLGMDETYDIMNVDGDSEAILYGGNKMLLAFNNFNLNLMSSLTPFLMVYAFYGLMKNRISRSRAYTIILLVLIAQVSNAIAFGSRGNMFLSFCAFGFYLILFYKRLGKGDKHIIKVVGISLLVIFSIYAAITSVARYQDSDTETPLGSVVRYLGEPFPNLSNNFYEHVSYHPEGTRLFPYVNGGPELINTALQGAYTYWEGVTGVPVRTFKTIFGDLYIEYGVEKALVIIALIALAFNIFLGRRKITYWKIAFIYWYFDLVLQGIFGFNKSGTGNMIVFVAILLVSLCFKFAFREHDNDSTSGKSDKEEGKVNTKLISDDNQ